MEKRTIRKARGLTMNYTLTPMQNELFYQREWILDGRLEVKMDNLCKKVEKDFNDKYKNVFMALGVSEYDRYNMLNISINRTTRGVHHSYEVMIGNRKFAKNVNKTYYTPIHSRIDWEVPLKVPFFIQSGELSDEFSIDFIKHINAIEAVEIIYNQLSLLLRNA